MRNPLVKELSAQLSSAEVRMLNALEAAYRLLDKEADALYESGADSQATELAVIAEDIVSRIEEIAEEIVGEGGGPSEGSELELSGREVEQISLDADLADAYHDWIEFTQGRWPRRQFESREEWIDLLRRIADMHPSIGRPLDPSVTDQQLVEAARDAYESLVSRRRSFL